MFSHANDATNFIVTLCCTQKDDRHYPVTWDDKQYTSQITAQQHAETYQSIANEIEKTSRIAINNELFISIKIMLKGRLRGEAIDMRFKDLNTYHQFLQFSGLLPAAEMKLSPGRC